MPTINRLQVALGFLGLLAGLALYLVDRGGNVYFLAVIGMAETADPWKPPLLRVAGGCLPAYLHVFSFSLLSAGLIACGKRGCLIVCGIWLGVNLLFELGQYYASTAANLVPRWFDGVFLFDHVRTYFLGGTFDPLDLLACLAGAASAYGVTAKTIKRGKRK